MASRNTSNGRAQPVHQASYAIPPEEHILGGPDCAICHWHENAPPAFTDEMHEIMEDIFQKGEIIRQRSARNRGVTTFVRKHSSLLPKQGSQTEPKSA